MRKPRPNFPRPCYVHLINRTVNREFLFGRTEKEFFVELMRRVEAFTGCTVLTFVIMSNHYHILLAENSMPEIDDAELLARMEALYGAGHTTFKEDKEWLLMCREAGMDHAAEELRQKYLARMHNVAGFMHCLNQRFAEYINRTKKRTGHLWGDRYKRIDVERDSDALSAMACYIDMNPVRAGLEEDPAMYRWSGYGAASGGVEQAQAGLVRLYEVDSTRALGSGADAVEAKAIPENPKRQESDTAGAGNAEAGDGAAALAGRWKNVAARYRMLVFETGVRKSDASGRTTRPGFSREQIQKVLDRVGLLTMAQFLRCRSSYFSSSVAFGSQKFIKEIEPVLTKQFGFKKSREPQSIEEADTDFKVFRRRRRRRGRVRPS